MSTTIYTELFCQFCGKSCKNKNSQVNHQRLCKSNPNRQSTHFQTEYNKTRKPTNQFIKAEYLGLEKPKLTDEQRQKISAANKNYVWTEERKLIHSIAMKQAVLENPDSYSKSNRGRVKHIKKYDIIFDGSWELKFYEWCLDNNIIIIDNKKFFPYYWNNSMHLYNPDFYIESLDIFVEVKGFYDDRDICKWKDFPENLFILDKNSIKLIDSNNFKIDYIIENKKDFI